MTISVRPSRRGRRIALIAPPWYPVPPVGYGGTELVVGLLTRELRAQGHEVLLFAAQGSGLATHVAAPARWGLDLGRPEERMRETAYAATVLRALQVSEPVDVVHDHCGGAMLLGATLLRRAPVVHTVHGFISEAERTCLTSLPGGLGLIAISHAQRRSAPGLPWVGTVHNAVALDALRVGTRAEKEPYLLCLARVCAAKGQHLAIEVARRTGRRLVLAGKVETAAESLEYHRRCVAPAVDGDRVVHLHNVAGEEKARLLARATALLAPLQWEEPFGLALAEAMASGTPVLAFPRGAAPELVVPGVTGLLVRDVEEMAAAVDAAAAMDPQACAALARWRFSPARAAADYLAAYERAVEGATRGVTPERAASPVTAPARPGESMLLRGQPAWSVGNGAQEDASA
jgi:glycosyltransferase involved in cell wall biosynthesis